MYKDLLPMAFLKSFIAFSLIFMINIHAGIKIAKRKVNNTITKQRNVQKLPNFNSSTPNTLTIQKNAEKIDALISETMLTLQRFEALLDNINNIVSQKTSKMSPTQMRHAEEYIHMITEMRSQLYISREKILEEQPKNLSEMRSLLSNIGFLLSIVIQFARSLDITINNKFKRVKSFEIEKAIIRSKKEDQAKYVVERKFELQDLISSIEQGLNDFDITKTNKVFQFFNTWVINPFFGYNLNSILWYASLWGLPSAMFLWQFGGKIANNNEYKDLVETGALGFYSTDPQGQGHMPRGEELFPERISNYSGKITGFHKQPQKPGKPFELTERFKKTQNLLMLSWYEACKRWIGFPSSYFSGPDMLGNQQKQMIYSDYKKQYFETNNISYKARIIGTVDDTLTGYVSQQYPIITMGFPLIAPAIQKVWTESLWPTVKTNITTLWNKLMGGVFENRSSDNPMFELIVSDFSLDDVIGMENEKELLNILIDYLMNPITFTQRYGNKIDKAFVFTGPTRTGKTYLFKAFIGSLQRKLRMLGKPIRTIRAYEFPVALVKQYGITAVLNWMRALAPAVFFIDEIDLVQLQRTTDSTVLADFLTGLGNTLNDDPTRPIILFCATNKIENLDKALRTKGRLGEEIRFDYPSYTHRKEFLEKTLKKLGLNSRKIDIDALVQQLGEQAYETISYVLNAAIMQASIAGVPFSQEHFERAIDRSIRGIMIASRKDLVKEEKLILAAHFAGHILAFLLLSLHEALHKVTIKAVAPQIKEEHVYADLYQKEEQKQKKIVFGSIYVSAKGDSDKLATKEMRILVIKRLLAGYIAEELLLGSCGYTCHPEYKEEAYEIALGMLLFGIKFDSLPDALKTDFAQKAIELLEKYMQEMRELFNKNIKLLRFMSHALLTQEDLSQKQIQELYQQFKQEQENVENKEQEINTQTP